MKKNKTKMRSILYLMFFAALLTSCIEENIQYEFKDSNEPVSIFDTSIEGLTVSFNNASIHATDYRWDFGVDGLETDTSSAENPEYTYDEKGFYTVNLTAIDGNGLDSTFIQEIAVGFPIASFEYVLDVATVTTANNSGNANAFEWNFGDGTISQEENPVHVYTSPGTYTIQLVAINGTDTDTASTRVPVEFKNIPTINFPSFESSNGNWRGGSDAGAWDHQGVSSTGSPSPPDGTNGAKLSDPGDFISQPLQVTPGASYFISFWYVTRSGVDGVNFDIIDTDRNTSILSEKTGLTPTASAYVKAEYSFSTGEAENIEIRYSYTDTEFRVDLVEIE